MINGLLHSKGNLTMSWASFSLHSPKSPLHTLPFLKLRISINHLLSLWMASAHTSQRKKKTLRYKLQSICLSCHLPSFLCQWRGGVLWRWSPWPLHCPLQGHCYHAWYALGLSLLISSYHQRPLSFPKKMKRTANLKGDSSDLYLVMMSIYFCLLSWSLNLLRT